MIYVVSKSHAAEVTYLAVARRTNPLSAHIITDIEESREVPQPTQGDEVVFLGADVDAIPIAKSWPGFFS